MGKNNTGNSSPQIPGMEIEELDIKTLANSGSGIKANKIHLVVLGQLPGFNSEIDPNFALEKLNLRNIPLIDFIPVSYSIPLINKMMSGASEGLSKFSAMLAEGEFGTMGLYLKNGLSSSYNSFKSLLSSAANSVNQKGFVGASTSALADGVQNLTKLADSTSLYNYEASPENECNFLFNLLLMRYVNLNWGVDAKSHISSYLKEDKKNKQDEAKIKQGSEEYLGVRLIAANDAMYNESISNSFGQNEALNVLSNNPLVNAFSGAATSLFNKGANAITNATKINALNTVQNLPKLSYGDALKVFEGSSTGNIITQIAQSKFLGMNIALPKAFNSSNFSDNFSITVKLSSPSGHPIDIQNYIINPLKIFLSMAAPITQNLETYYLPLLWKVQGYGIHNDLVAYINNITIMKGGMENSVNDYLQPTMIEVRLTLSTISETMAAVAAPDVLVSDTNERNAIGMTTPLRSAESMDQSKYKREKYTVKL